MKKFKIFKILFISIMYVFAIIFSIIFPKYINYEKIGIITSVVVLFTSLFQYLQKESSYVFIKSQKFFSLFNRDTVSWESAVKFKVAKRVSLLKNISKVISSMEDINILEKDKKTDKLFLKINYSGYTHLINITENTDLNTLTIHYTSSISYKDSKKAFSRFLFILKAISQDISELTPNLYEVKIHFAKSNPFYKFIVRHVDESTKANFHLNFVDKDEAEINIYNNRLEVKSKSYSYIKSVLKDYVVISNIR